MIKGIIRNAIELTVYTILSLAQISAFGQSFEDVLKAVERGDAVAVRGFIERGLDPNTTDATGHSILMTAARLGHLALVALLIERRANLHALNPQGDTALMFASLKGHLPVVQLLLEKGAKLRASGWTELHYAAFEGRGEVIRHLIRVGASKDSLAPNGDSALMLAARGGHVEAARALLYEDADFRVKGPKGETALGIALTRKDGELVELLKRAGAVE